jgi:hypothetical protein
LSDLIDSQGIRCRVKGAKRRKEYGTGQGIEELRDLGIEGFRDLGIEEFRNLGIEYLRNYFFALCGKIFL